MIVKNTLIGKLTLDNNDYRDLINKPTIDGVEISGEINLTAYAKTEDILLKQDIEDKDLSTTEKTIVGAINELAKDIKSYEGAKVEYASFDDIDALFG